MNEDDLAFCVDCMEPFRYDDCGGYNPPCECGAHCRSCHEASEREMGSFYEDEDMSMEEALERDAEYLRAMGADPGPTADDLLRGGESGEVQPPAAPSAGPNGEKAE